MPSLPIVAGYDGSAAARAALRWAADASVRHRAPLRVVYAARPGPRPAARSAPPALTNPWDGIVTPDAMVSRGVRGAEARGAHPVTGVVLDGPAAAVLCEQSTRARMLVLGVHGNPDRRPGSTVRTVLATTACPVVTVRDGDPGDARLGPVIVGVDQTAEAQSAIALAVAEAAASGCGLTAVRVWTPQAPPRHGDAHDHLLRTAAQAATERDILAAALHGWADKYPDVAITQVLVAGETGPALALRSRSARLLVVAPHRASRHRGAVSRYLLRHTACPLALAVPLPAAGA